MADRHQGDPPAHRRAERSAHHRLEKMRAQSLTAGPTDPSAEGAERNVAVDCGWGRVLFAQTFEGTERLVEALRREKPERRDIAFYIRDPHVLISHAPQELFLDPSHTYRLPLYTYRPSKRRFRGFFVRRLSTRADAEAVNRIYESRRMVQVPPDFYWERADVRVMTHYVAEDAETQQIIGTVGGINHIQAFDDPERGSSLWCLAVDPRAQHAGIGEALIRRLAEHFKARGCDFMDLSVLHDNAEAISLYEKLGFERVPFFAVKTKNSINERLYTGPPVTEDFNPYAMIIIHEARRRGIQVEPLDPRAGYFRLTYGGRSLVCRESLSELTTAIAMSRCADKAVTKRLLDQAGLKVAAQVTNPTEEGLNGFLAQYPRVVVKPVDGEQGRGVAVDLSDPDAIRSAIDEARQVHPSVLVEEFVAGADLRVIVIDYRLVAAAIRRPPVIQGDGVKTAEQLISALSRRRAAATGGESSIPLDRETLRQLDEQGYALSDVVPAGTRLPVRKTANLHTGGTLHDVTDSLHPRLVDAAVKAARVLDIPVTGLDFLVASPQEPDYVIIEANERPGLCNHEPQPTAERFIDLLFPQSVPAAVKTHGAQH